MDFDNGCSRKFYKLTATNPLYTGKQLTLAQSRKRSECRHSFLLAGHFLNNQQQSRSGEGEVLVQDDNNGIIKCVCITFTTTISSVASLNTAFYSFKQ